MPEQTPLPPPGDDGNEFVKAIYNVVTSIPPSTEPQNQNPSLRAVTLTSDASIKSAAIAGSLALPPGPIGMLTILPDLVTVWRIQRQLVSDIAACHGKQAVLTREVMLYCLFRHGAAVFVRDLITRVGERYLVRRVSLRLFQQILQRLGFSLTQRVIGRTVSRYIPLLGAAGIAAYSYFDTKRVGKTANETFSQKIELSPDEEHGA